MQQGNGSVAYNGSPLHVPRSETAGAHKSTFHIEDDGVPRSLGLTRHYRAYKMEHKVGEGAYGAVFFARDPKSNKVVALKRVAWTADPSNSEGLPVTTLREIMLLYAVRHENVVHLEEVLHGTAL